MDGPIFLLPLASAILSGIVASNKGRNVVGWVLIGLFFPLFGLIAIAALPEVKRTQQH